MLESITIKNFGIIENISIECSTGLNVLTGETGAGKSILIDALRFCLGERFQASHLRDGADQCLVEAVLKLDKKIIKNLTTLDNFPSEDNTLIIQRTVTSDGKNRVKINGLTATVAQLKEIGDRLIDFHGPHDHQLLLAENMHLEILDALTDFGKDKAAYFASYEDRTELQKKIAVLQELAQSRDRDLDLLTHQIKELGQVPLDEEHFKELEADQTRINNSEKLFENIDAAMSALEGDESALEATLNRAYKPLQKLADIDGNAASYLDELSSLQENARTLISNLRDYAESLHFDPDYAKEINEKFDIYHDIRRKYGPGLEDARKLFEDAKQKFDLLSDFEHNEESLHKDLSAVEKKLGSLASELTRTRKKTAAFLKKTIEKELEELGFKSVLFEARIEQVEFGADGRDKVIFFISPNAGENLKPLAEIVSSGESARIMLAIKKALMKVDPVPVLIFDEIDAQIGGRLGTVIGTKLKEISLHRQVFLITHLPQIAAYADTHFKISKVVENARTKTRVLAISGKERVQELAHMMAGDSLTETTLKHARELLGKATN